MRLGRRGLVQPRHHPGQRVAIDRDGRNIFKQSSADLFLSCHQPAASGAEGQMRGQDQRHGGIQAARRIRQKQGIIGMMANRHGESPGSRATAPWPAAGGI